MEQVADGGRGQPPGGRVLVDLPLEPDLEKFILLGGDIFGEEVGGPVEAHIHKGRGHAGQEPGHPALVDVAHGTVLGPAFDVKLRQAAVFEKSHPGVPFRDADEEQVGHREKAISYQRSAFSGVLVEVVCHAPIYGA